MINISALRAGVCKVNITPPIGTLMAGFAGRDHGCEGIHDELYSRVLYFNDGQEECIIAGNDLCNLSNEAADWIREKGEEETGVPAENIFLNCTHTHSGPIYRELEHKVSRRYQVSMYDKIVGAIKRAKDTQEDVKIGWGEQPVQCGVNRRERRGDTIVLGDNPDGPVLPKIDILKIISEKSGHLLSVLFCHPVHCVIRGSDNYKISGDLAGAAERFVEKNISATAIFIQGCAGNINSQPSCCTRGYQTSFADVELLGQRLGSVIIKGLTEINNYNSNINIKTSETKCYLPLEEPPSVEEAQENLKKAEKKLADLKNREGIADLRYAHDDYQNARDLAQVAREGLDEPGLPFSMQAIALGDYVIVGFPAEVFVELGEQIKQKSKFENIIVAGYTNGAWLYIPIKSAFSEGGYEVKTRCKYKGLHITEEAGQVVVDQAVKMLDELYKDV